MTSNKSAYWITLCNKILCNYHVDNLVFQIDQSEFSFVEYIMSNNLSDMLVH